MSNQNGPSLTEYKELPIAKRSEYISKLLKIGYTVYELSKLGIPRTSIERANSKLNLNNTRFEPGIKNINGEQFQTIPIKGYERYMVSKTGKVYSVRNDTLFKPYIDADGYEKIGLRSTIDKKRHLFGVHQLVLRTFKGEPPETINDPTVDHIDGCVRNNSIENLQWLPRTINSNAKHKHYSTNHKANNRSIPDSTVHNICELISKGLSISEISLRLNVKENVVKSIKSGQTFRYISNLYNFTKNIKLSDKIPIEEFYNLYFDSSVSIKDIMNKYNCAEKIIRKMKENLYDWENAQEYSI